MKKQLLAAAVATAIAAPMAASADVTVYGTLHYSIDSIDMDAAAPTPASSGFDADVANGYDGTAVSSHDSFFGIKGSEDLGNGLSLVFQMEFQISGDDLGNNQDITNDHNTYVALAGSWGVAGIGQVDTPYNSSSASLELFADTVGDYEQLGFNDVRAPDAVFYMSPNWNGFSFVAAVVMPSDIGGGDIDADGVEATSIAAMYSNGPWYASLAYESISDEFIQSLHAALPTVNDYDFDKWRLGLGYTANGWHVGFIYEDREMEDLSNIAGYNSDDSESWQLSASYTAGNNTFKVAYGEADDWGMTGTNVPYAVDDAEQWSIGVYHKLSNRTKVYAAYSDYSDDVVDTDWDALSVGIVHTF